MKRYPTAAMLVIGNEILSGKIRESNVYELARLLRELGLVLARVLVVPDDRETVARETKALSEAHDYVFTSGGVGPTHDDVTISGIALAFGVPVVRDPKLEALIRRHYGDGLHPNHLMLASVPEGSRQIYGERSPWPLTAVENVFILPGVPEVFRMKLDILRGHLGVSAPFVTRAVYTKMDEALLKPILDEVVSKHPGVEVGSYPRWNDPDYETKVTLDGRDEKAVTLALEHLLRLLPRGEPQWTE